MGTSSVSGFLEFVLSSPDKSVSSRRGTASATLSLYVSDFHVTPGVFQRLRCSPLDRSVTAQRSWAAQRSGTA